MKSAPILLIALFTLVALSLPASSAPTLDTVQVEIGMRIAELAVLPAPTKAEKKEAKHLGKALAGLALYTGTHDKDDLKKALSRAVKHVEKSGSLEPEAVGWIDSPRLTLESVSDQAASAAEAARNALVTPKYRNQVDRHIAKAEAKRAKADGLWPTGPGKAARTLVKGILKFRKAEAKALKLLAKEGGGPGPVPLERAALAIVLDGEGNPVPHARVGGQILTDENGVAVGDVTPSASGWVEVRASGHATGWTEEAGVLDGSSLYLARVTAQDALVHLDTGDEREVTAGGGELPPLIATLSAADFAALPVTVAVTAIAPLDVGPLHAPFPGYTDHSLRVAFALEVRDLAGSDVPLVAGSDVAVDVEDGGELGDTPILGRFDPVSGAWEASAGTCVRVDADHVRCDVSLPASLLGLFAPGPSSLVAAPRTPGPADLAFRIAQAEFARAVSLSLDPPNDPEVALALAALAQAARDLAASSQNEKGKFALLMASVAARSVGDDALADALADEALDLAQLIALALLQTNDCGYVEVMYAAAAQVDMLGGSATVVDQLLDRVGNLRAECGRWVGSIHFFLNIEPVHPGLDNLTLVVGGGAWREDHFVVLEVDPKTGELTASDRLQHTLTKQFYQDESDECEISIDFYGEPFQATLELGYTGSWSPGGFSIGAPSLTSGSPPSITQHQHFEAEQDGSCQVITDSTFAFPNHISLMAHGLWDATPVVTLDEMLNSGDASSGSIQGGRLFTNPIPDGGKYPFEWGMVSWSFTRIR